MGAIKDIVDLTKDLESRAKDRKDMEVIHKIQSLSFSLQEQHADIVERDIALMQQNATLRGENEALQKKLQEAQSETLRIHRFIEFHRSERTNSKWVPFCPICHIPAFNEEGAFAVVCPNGNCNWSVALDGIALSTAIRELG